MVKVTYIGPIRAFTGKLTVTYEVNTPITVQELVQYLIDQHGNKFKEEISAESNGALIYQIIVNNNNIQSVRGFGTEINDGDEILISLPLAGG